MLVFVLVSMLVPVLMVMLVVVVSIGVFKPIQMGMSVAGQLPDDIKEPEEN